MPGAMRLPPSVSAPGTIAVDQEEEALQKAKEARNAAKRAQRRASVTAMVQSDVSEVFLRHDVEKTGELNVEQLADALTELGLVTKKSDAARVLKRYDRTGRGTIDSSHFDKMVNDLRRFKAERAAKKAKEAAEKKEPRDASGSGAGSSASHAALGPSSDDKGEEIEEEQIFMTIVSPGNSSGLATRLDASAISPVTSSSRHHAHRSHGEGHSHRSQGESHGHRKHGEGHHHRHAEGHHHKHAEGHHHKHGDGSHRSHKHGEHGHGHHHRHRPHHKSDVSGGEAGASHHSTERSHRPYHTSNHKVVDASADAGVPAEAGAPADESDIATRRRSRVSFGPATLASETNKPLETEQPVGRAFTRTTQDRSSRVGTPSARGMGELSARPVGHEDEDESAALRARKARSSTAGRGRVGSGEGGRGNSERAAASRARREALKDAGESATETLVDVAAENVVRANRVCI